MLKQQVQTALRVLFPPSCSLCREPVESDFALCGSCWRDVPFISGPVCSKCGSPVLAADEAKDLFCEDCYTLARPWRAGRAAILYRDSGRKLVLALKHGDRPDLAPTFAPWLAQAGRDLVAEGTIIAPVPLHWRRMIKRRYNQSALLAQHLALITGQVAVLDLLQRPERTKPLDGVTVPERFARLQNAIRPNPARTDRVAGKSVLIVDDVMTSGATLAAATEASLSAGAADVNILVLARVCKDI